MRTTSSAVAAIHQVVSDAVEFQNDVDRFVPLHTDATSIVNLRGRRVSGRGD
ncbi:hypothetical protein [Rhodococcus sp. NPDC127528]|uniref:hypothetical protein n=1 Tax=unclassified Rhodococcus (in: high G+C Gram-positive bacteria) TaxID=192944 RepID=UPI00363AE672